MRYVYHTLWWLRWYEAYSTQANQIIGTKYGQLNHGNNMARRCYNSIAFNLNHLRVGSSLNSWKLFCEILLNINNYYLNIIVYILAKKEKREKKPNLFPLSNQFCCFFVFFTEVKLKTNLQIMVHVEVRIELKAEKILVHVLVWVFYYLHNYPASLISYSYSKG